MSTWKYRYQSFNSPEIREDYLEINDDNRVMVIERIQKLRIKLNRKGCQFVDAAPVDGTEWAIGNKLAGLRRFKRPSRIRPKRRSFSWLFLGSLLLLALLWLLASW